MKILAVSDEISRSLETLVANAPERFRDIDCIVSCGDLDRGYLEFLVDRLHKTLFFVPGNHTPGKYLDYAAADLAGERLWQRALGLRDRKMNDAAGGQNMHGRVDRFGGFLFAGFEGSLWYNGGDNQYTERQMARVVRRVARKTAWLHLLDRLRGRRPRPVIVISHAPVFRLHDQPDLCHQGFKCFAEFIRKVKPLLWIHGHIHLDDLRKNQVSVAGNATVINAFGCKIIEIESDKIQVYSHCDIDKSKNN